MLIMSADKAKELGYTPIARLVSYGYAGVEPQRMGIAPAYAVPKALKKAGLTLQDMDLVEINEAFAAQVLSVGRLLHDRRGLADAGHDDAGHQFRSLKLNGSVKFFGTGDTALWVGGFERAAVTIGIEKVHHARHSRLRRPQEPLPPPFERRDGGRRWR